MAENVQVKIGANTTGLQSGLSKGQQAVQKFGQVAERVSQGFRSTLYGIMSSHPYLMAIGGSILAIGSALSILRNRVNGLDALAKQAKSVNLTTDAYQELELASRLAGVQMEKVLTMINRIDNAVSQGATGTERYVKAFEKLGLSVKSVEALTPQEKIYALLEARKIHGENSETNKALLDILGLKNMQDFRKMEKTDFEKMAAYASSTGHIVNAKQIELAEAYADAIAIEAQHMKAVVDNSKILKEYTKIVEETMSHMSKGDSWDAPIPESNPLSQRKENQAVIARDKLIEKILSNDTKLRAEFERRLSEQLGPKYTGGVGNVTGGLRTFTDEQLANYLKLNEKGSLADDTVKRIIALMLKEPEWLGYDPSYAVNFARNIIDKKGKSYQSTPEEIRYGEAQIMLDSLSKSFSTGKVENGLSLTTEAVNEFIASIEKLNGIKLKQEDIDDFMDKVNDARANNLNEFIMRRDKSDKTW